MSFKSSLASHVVDNAGFKITKKEKKKRYRNLKKELRRTDMLTDIEEGQVGDIWRLGVRQKWKLFR